MSHHPERTARNVRPVNQPPSILNGTFTLANENYVVVYFRCSLGLNPPVQAG